MNRGEFSEDNQSVAVEESDGVEGLTVFQVEMRALNTDIEYWAGVIIAAREHITELEKQKDWILKVYKQSV